ncbi:hypothetical protein [Pseudonocardia humida]|uniref:Uncharacterized protein n=1 Tax=Pseudonocardia humida TaxID=2800819 RepID=A0ABT1A632_9PSEU|nr:hypothetical protein [Pseudonocardia humida]MCO1658464.1 hypothetical protein [Pseudonocardia humida]
MGDALLAPLAFLLALLGPTTTEPSVLLGLTAVLLAALLAARAAPPPATHTPAVAVRARRRALDQGPPPRQHDPDAAGHARPRAPSPAFAAV